MVGHLLGGSQIRTAIKAAMAEIGTSPSSVSRQAPSTIGDTVPCAELFDPSDRTFTTLSHCPTAGLGALPSVASAPGHGAMVLAGVHGGGGGAAFGIIGQGPTPTR